MKSGIKDKNGITVKVGDNLEMPYIDPFGKLTQDYDYTVKVVFDHGCFGYYDETRFHSLHEWQRVELGDYISNCGNKKIYTGDYPFWIEI